MERELQMAGLFQAAFSRMVSVLCLLYSLQHIEIAIVKVLYKFKEMNVTDKKHTIDFIQPTNIDINGAFSMCVNSALSKILLFKNSTQSGEFADI